MLIVFLILQCLRYHRSRCFDGVVLLRFYRYSLSGTSRRRVASSVKEERNQSRSQAEDLGWSLCFSLIYHTQRKLKIALIVCFQDNYQSQWDQQIEKTLVFPETKWRLHWGQNSFFVCCYCFLYKLQMEPEVSQIAFELLFLCNCKVDECCFRQSLVQFMNRTSDLQESQMPLWQLINLSRSYPCNLVFTVHNSSA